MNKNAFCSETQLLQLMLGEERKIGRGAEVDTWCRNVGSFPSLPLLQCPKAPGYHGTDGTVCGWVGGWV